VTPREHVRLADHTTLGLGGEARYWAEAEREADIPAAAAWARQQGLPWMPLGGGSNVLASDAGYDGLILHLALPGVRELGGGRVEAAAGEDWDGFVAWCVARGLAGLECLSGIPGTVGATPVQNVGAYGQEVAETIQSVRAWDRQAEAWVELPASACGFGYRSSRFQPGKGRFVIAAVRFALRPGGAAALRYPELRRQFPDPAAAPSLSEVREAVRAIRRGKAMLIEPGDPECRSAGSFFKNPVVSEAAAAELARRLGAAPPQFPAAAGQVKLPAAWLIEQAGFHKGYRPAGSGVGLSRRHVLAIVNYGSGTAAAVAALAGQIQSAVAAKTGIALHPEPVWLGPAAGGVGAEGYQPRR